MRLLAPRFDDLPFEEAGLAAGAAILLCTVLVPAGHGGFVGGDDFVSGAVLADGAAVDPEDALAEAANLTELMGDEDHGAAGAGDVAHLAEALFLEGEDRKSTRLNSSHSQNSYAGFCL